MRFFILACLVATASAGSADSLEEELSHHLDLTKFQAKMEDLRVQIEEKLQKTPEEEEEIKERLAAIGDYSIPKGVFKDGEDVTEINEEAGLDQDLFEGDMMLTDDQLDQFQITNPHNMSRARRQAQTGPRFPSNTWGANPTIPFVFDASYPAGANKNAILGAVDFWTQNTCLRFAQNGAAKDRVKFIFGQGCYSYVGRVGGEQPISIGNGCGSVGTVAHEMAHTFGIFHVQSRYDRNDFVLVNEKNIERSKMNNFDIESKTSSDNYGIPYEFGSNMHYGQADFGLDRSQPALVARNQHSIYQNSMQGRLPTFYDILLVNKYYNCDKNCKTSITCSNGGVQDVNKCSQCRCPNGWTGTTCTQRPAGTKTIQVTPTAQSFMAEAGDKKNAEVQDFHNQYYVLTAPAGKRVELSVKQVAGVTSSNCYIGGAEVKFLNDARLAGIKVCDGKLRQAPIVSEGNTMVINAYNRYAFNQFEFSARAV